MKLLVLSCNTGQGHNSAGIAVKEAFERAGADCVMKDALTFAHRKRTTDIVSSGYTGIVSKAPKVFGGLYLAGSLISSPNRKSPVYFANAHYADRLYEYIKLEGFDGVVAPHLFPVEVMTKLKKTGRTEAKCYAVATDYTCIPFWEETTPDYFFIPHEDLTEEFCNKGIPRRKIIAAGIPTAAKYGAKTERGKARRMLNLEEDATVFLIMTGSMGFGEISSMISGILELAPPKSNVLVLTGRNDKLRSEIKNDFSGDIRVRAVPYTTETPLYMDACDALLTKPGGLTSTEAAVKNVPLIHTEPIPGCETKNAIFFSSRGLSVFERRPQDACASAVRLALNEKEKNKMLALQRENIAPDAADKIAKFILNDI